MVNNGSPHTLEIEMEMTVSEAENKLGNLDSK